jgi:hypothetical protein
MCFSNNSLTSCFLSWQHKTKFTLGFKRNYWCYRNMTGYFPGFIPRVRLCITRDIDIRSCRSLDVRKAYIFTWPEILFCELNLCTIVCCYINEKEDFYVLNKTLILVKNKFLTHTYQHIYTHRISKRSVGCCGRVLQQTLLRKFID